MDGGIKGPSLNNCRLCLVWKQRLLGCLTRRRAMFVGMSEQSLCLLLAEELKRQQICKDRIETANGCQSTQQVEGTASLKVWGEMLMGMWGTQTLGQLSFGGQPARRVAMKAMPCLPCCGPSDLLSEGARDTGSCRGAALKVMC